jgi:hypothetical protein
MKDQSSRKLMLPKVLSKKCFDDMWELIEVLHNNVCCIEKTLIKEIGESHSQNVKKIMTPGFVLAG